MSANGANNFSANSTNINVYLTVTFHCKRLKKSCDWIGSTSKTIALKVLMTIKVGSALVGCLLCIGLLTYYTNAFCVYWRLQPMQTHGEFIWRFRHFTEFISITRWNITVILLQAKISQKRRLKAIQTVDVIRIMKLQHIKKSIFIHTIV